MTAKNKKSNARTKEDKSLFQWPSQKELFDAALKLAVDKDFYRDEAHLYVKRALWLWVESEKAVNIESRTGYLEPKIPEYSKADKNHDQWAKDYQKYYEELTGIWDGVAFPKKYPVNFNGFLAALFPRRTSTDRVKIFRDFLRSNARLANFMRDGGFGDLEDYKLPDQTEVAPWLERWKKETNYKNESQFRFHGESVMKFYQHYKQKNASQKAAKAAKVRAAKKKSKKKQ